MKQRPKFRNKFEAAQTEHLPDEFQYEAVRLPYRLTRHYLPDFIDTANKRIIELKGRFPASDRQKMKAVRRQYPDYEITIIFQRANTRISKNSQTTYASWCEKNGIQWRQA